MAFSRLLKLDLPEKQSAFLWGARQTGKSTFLKSHFKGSYYIDLLHSDVHIEFAKQPHLLRERVLALSPDVLQHPIIIDEVQKVPALLDEVHWLIENTAASFILCGSSARKLKRGAANLLGGRAWTFEFFPLTSAEIPDFDLFHALQNGLLPKCYREKEAKRSLRAYVNTYLKEEVYAEGLIRQLAPFARFMESLAFSHGQPTNYTNIARECGIDAKTVKEYYHILEDTLLGHFVEPFRKTAKRAILTSIPKFYLFDVGVAGYLSKRSLPELKGSQAGEAFEHFIFMELIAYRGLSEQDFPIAYWRTKTGLEVDFVLGGGEVAIEVKLDRSVSRTALTGLIAFAEEYQPQRSIVVSLDRERRLITTEHGSIEVLPWEIFLSLLWQGKMI